MWNVNGTRVFSGSSLDFEKIRDGINWVTIHCDDLHYCNELENIYEIKYKNIHWKAISDYKRVALSTSKMKYKDLMIFLKIIRLKYLDGRNILFQSDNSDFNYWLAIMFSGVLKDSECNE